MDNKYHVLNATKNTEAPITSVATLPEARTYIETQSGKSWKEAQADGWEVGHESLIPVEVVIFAAGLTDGEMKESFDCVPSALNRCIELAKAEGKTLEFWIHTQWQGLYNEVMTAINIEPDTSMEAAQGLLKTRIAECLNQLCAASRQWCRQSQLEKLKAVFGIHSREEVQLSYFYQLRLPQAVDIAVYKNFGKSVSPELKERIYISHELYWDFLEVLPPRYQGHGGFGMAEGEDTVRHFREGELYFSYVYTDLYLHSVELVPSSKVPLSRSLREILSAWFDPEQDSLQTVEIDGRMALMHVMSNLVMFLDESDKDVTVDDIKEEYAEMKKELPTPKLRAVQETITTIIVCEINGVPSVHFTCAPLKGDPANGDDRWYPIGDSLHSTVKTLMVESGIAHDVTKISLLREGQKHKDYRVIFDKYLDN